MPIRNNPKHIQEFTLAPVCHFIHTRRGRDLRLAIFKRNPQLQ